MTWPVFTKKLAVLWICDYGLQTEDKGFEALRLIDRGQLMHIGVELAQCTFISGGGIVKRNGL